jgi:hypothetical protein
MCLILSKIGYHIFSLKMETHCVPIIKCSTIFFKYINFQHEKIVRVLKTNDLNCDILLSESYRGVLRS